MNNISFDLHKIRPQSSVGRAKSNLNDEDTNN
jgi:hypothetical protein